MTPTALIDRDAVGDFRANRALETFFQGHDGHALIGGSFRNLDAGKTQKLTFFSLFPQLALISAFAHRWQMNYFHYTNILPPNAAEL